MESGAGVAVGVAPTSGPAAAGRNVVGHAADEGGVILAGWFRSDAHPFVCVSLDSRVTDSLRMVLQKEGRKKRTDSDKILCPPGWRVSCYCRVQPQHSRSLVFHQIVHRFTTQLFSCGGSCRFFISYYADYSEHKGPTGLKGEIPIHPRRTNTEVFKQFDLISR